MVANALGPPIKPKYEPKLPRPVNITAGAAITEGGGGGRQTGEDEVEALDGVGEVGEEEGASGPIRWIPQMGTLEVLRLKRENMRNRLPLVPFVLQRNVHKIPMVLVPARG